MIPLQDHPEAGLLLCPILLFLSPYFYACLGSFTDLFWGRPLKTYHQHRNPFFSVCFQDDGTKLRPVSSQALPQSFSACLSSDVNSPESSAGKYHPKLLSGWVTASVVCLYRSPKPVRTRHFQMSVWAQCCLPGCYLTRAFLPFSETTSYAFQRCACLSAF